MVTIVVTIIIIIILIVVIVIIIIRTSLYNVTYHPAAQCKGWRRETAVSLPLL